MLVYFKQYCQLVVYLEHIHLHGYVQAHGDEEIHNDERNLTTGLFFRKPSLNNPPIGVIWSKNLVKSAHGTARDHMP